MDTISIEEQGIADKTNHLSEINDVKAVETIALKSRQINALQFSQILEEEHESESAATSSVNHSRCTSLANLNQSKAN